VAWCQPPGWTCTVLLARQLELGQPAIMESVAPMQARQRWREMTVEAGHRFTAVECICTDRAVHRARFEQRRANPCRRSSGWRKATATMRRGGRTRDWPECRRLCCLGMPVR
jgi:hypothetical protein